MDIRWYKLMDAGDPDDTGPGTTSARIRGAPAPASSPQWRVDDEERI